MMIKIKVSTPYNVNTLVVLSIILHNATDVQHKITIPITSKAIYCLPTYSTHARMVAHIFATRPIKSITSDLLSTKTNG